MNVSNQWLINRDNRPTNSLSADLTDYFAACKIRYKTEQNQFVLMNDHPTVRVRWSSGLSPFTYFEKHLYTYNCIL